ncbi:MAG: hypothetical protein RL660_2305 [Bacteroidota bacterium]|jgi:hypothetical protein
MLHDGVIESWTGSKEKLLLKISCLYLAELINKDFEYFYVEIAEVQKIELDTWINPIEDGPQILTELSDIFKAELEILSAENKDSGVVITCNQPFREINYSGGHLTLNCTSVKVFKQDRNELTIKALKELCTQYWDSFRKRI